jgi:hypothetical protein
MKGEWKSRREVGRWSEKRKEEKKREGEGNSSAFGLLGLDC